jgi:hypothetical protein
MINTIPKNLRGKLYILAALLLFFASSSSLFTPGTANAAGQLTSRKLTLGSSAGNTATTWAFTFTQTETTALNGITFQVCTTASGACSAPGSWTNAGSAFTSLTYNGSAQTGWALDNAAGYLRVKNNTSATAVSGPVVVNFSSVTNPNTTNGTFYVRVLTYSGDDYTSQVDNGVVAASTSQQLNLSATVDETLTFCTATSGITTSSCAGATGSAVSFGTLSASSTNSAVSQLGVGTNAGTGYAITVNGTTLTSSGNTVTALASQTASSSGSEQFGLNLRDNATPNVGTDPDGSGTATPTATYNTVDQYRFITGETVASKGSSDQFRRFHASYIANIDTATEAGAYTSVLTYICTATF